MAHLIIWIIVGIIYGIGAVVRAISNAAAKNSTRPGSGYPPPPRPGMPPQFGAPQPPGQRPAPPGQLPYGYAPPQQPAQYGNQPPAGQQPYGYTQPQQPAQYGNQPAPGQQYGYQAPPQYQGQPPAYVARPPQPGYPVVPPAPQYGYQQPMPPPVAQQQPPARQQPRAVASTPTPAPLSSIGEQSLSTLAEPEPPPSTEASTAPRGFNDVLRSQPPLVAAMIMQEILGPPRSRRAPRKAP